MAHDKSGILSIKEVSKAARVGGRRLSNLVSWKTSLPMARAVELSDL